MKVMKRFLAMVLTLAMVATLFAGLTLTASATTATVTTGTYKKQSGTSITGNGSYILLFSGNYILCNSNAGSKYVTQYSYGSAPTSITIDNSNKQYVWTVSDYLNGSFKLVGPNGEAKGAKSSMSVASSGSTWTMDGSYIKTSDGYYIKWVSASGFRCYNTTGNKTALVAVYKLESKTLSSIAVSSNHRTFTTGATFVGETVTATYTDNSTATVNATFSGYNMNTAGTQTVTASYSEGGVTKTATYQITVSAPTPHTLTYSVNGDTSVFTGGSYTSGTSVTLPTASDIAGYTFAGWVADAIGTETTNAPTVLTGSYTMPAANTTLYAVYTRTEEVQGGGSSNEFTKVTTAPSDWSGDYLLVYEADEDTGYVFSGVDAAYDYVEAEIVDDSIAIDDGMAIIEIAAMTGGYSLKVIGGTNDGKYMYGTSEQNKLNFNNEAQLNTIAISNGSAVITSNTSVMRYNNTNSDTAHRFRYYKAAGYADQQPIQLYKKASGTTYYTTTVNTAATYYTLTYSVSPASSGSIDCEIANNGQVEEDTDVTLTATPADHFTFANWTVTGTEDYVDDGNELLVTMTDDVTVTANFTADPTYTVTITQAAGGTMTASKLTGIYAGETITLTATPNTHYSFNGWQCTAGGATISGNSFTMPAANVTITGTFSENTKYTVTYYDKDGSVEATEQVYAGETPASVPAIEAPNGYVFKGWCGTTYALNATEPTYVSTAAPITGNTDFHAVYARLAAGSSPYFKLSMVVDSTTYYVGTRTDSNSYLNAETTESNAAEFGVEEYNGAKYLYFMNGSTKTYISSVADGTDISFDTNISDATPWTVTENNGTVVFQTTYSVSGKINRYFSYNKQSPRFAAYNGVTTGFPREFTKIGGPSYDSYTTDPDRIAPVLTAEDDTVIFDRYRALTFNVLTNDDLDYLDATGVTVTFAGLPTNVQDNGDGTFTFTPAVNQQEVTFTYTITDNADNTNVSESATVTLKPAEKVYYDESDTGMFTFVGQWQNVTDPSLSSIDDIFAHEKDHFVMYSGGTAKQVTVSKGDNPSVEFTFAGTGFEIIAAMTNTSGAAKIEVYNNNNNDTPYKTAIVDTYRGYAYNEDDPVIRYTLKEVTRYKLVEDKYVAYTGAEGEDITDYNYYRDPVTKEFVEGETWYAPGDASIAPANSASAFEQHLSVEGNYVLIAVSSNWVPTTGSGANTYQIPILRMMGLPYGTYKVKVQPIYSAGFDRDNDGSYDFIFDGVNIYDPTGVAAYKYISLNDIVSENGFGSVELTPCEHPNSGNWTFYSPASGNATGEALNRGSFVKRCTVCGEITNTAYFNITTSANPTMIGLTGTSTLSYTLTSDNTDVLAILNGLTFTAVWTTNDSDVIRCNNGVATAQNNEGSTYAKLGLKVGDVQYASVIKSPIITVANSQPEGYTATFHVPAGATAPAAQTGNSVTMPAAVAAPAAFDAHNYTFVGWIGNTVSDTTTQQTFYAAGASIDLSADTDFYALYTYGGNAGGYTLSATAPKAGDSVIIAAEKDGTYYALPQDSFSGETLTVSGNTATNVDGLTWTAYDASYSGSTGIGFNNGTNPLHMNSSALKVASGDQNGTFEFTASGDGFIVYSNQNDRWMKYNGSSFGVANVASGATPIVFFISSGATYYTTNLAATCKHTNTTTTTVNATCTVAGSETVTCDDCGVTVSTTVLPALGHYYVPTPAAGGTTYTCSRCGDSYFEPAEFEVTYVLQPGVTVSGNSREGNAITLPNAASIPATYNAQTYTFVGWANATSADGTTDPTVYAKGEVVNITADTTFYPVYSYTTTSGGSTQEAGYYLADSVPTVGDEIIIAFKSGDTYYALPNGNKSSGASIAAETLTVSNGKATATSTNTFKLITNSGYMGIKSTADANYLGFNSNKISMNGWGDTKYAKITASGDQFIVGSSNNSPRGLSYSGTNFTVANAGGSPVYIFTYTEGGTGGGTTTTTYTFELKAASDSYAATLTPATLNMTTGSTASLTATLTNNGAVVTAEDVAFSSSNDSIVLVDEDTGYLVAGETAGTATITVEMLAADGEIYTATCAVTVKEMSDNPIVNYIGSASGNVKNWGTRGTTATFLTELADNYYTGSYSYNTLSALSGDSGSGTDFYTSALGTAIHNMLTAKQTSTTSYAGTTSLYAYTDCVESGNKISSYYSAVLVGPNWDSGSTWNREHTWPNSKGLDGADENDIMMIRPTSVSENSSRSNNAYGESSGYYDPNKLGQNLHGDVARLMLQHLMRWGNTSKFYGTGGVMESRAILLKWLAEDPVDTWELGRNDAVQRITGVRNVFVDYPELAFKLLGAEVPANYSTPSKSGIVAGATYSASAGSGYEPVTEAARAKSIAPAAKSATRSLPTTGIIGGAVVVDGKGNISTAADFKEYGPAYGVYLAPGQALVFKLSGSTEPSALAIGAKAVNATATQLDVATLNGETGIVDYLTQRPIASAAEQYYDLDLSKLTWTDGSSDVIIVYNAGDGILDVTNLRYISNSVLTLTINQRDTQKAAKMIRIVYGEPVTDPDPIEPTDLDLNFASAELVLNSDIAINFNVEEAVMDSADGIYAVFTKALYNDAGDITGYAEETVTEPIFNEETGLYSFRFTGINPAEMGSAVTATLYGYRNGELVEGKTINYSVLTYINNMYGKVNDADFRALIADLAAYGAAAQNYISYNTANLVTASAAEGLMAYATAEAPELSNATAISGEGKVKFTGAYLSLREKVTICYMIDAQEFDGNVADLELRIYDGKNLLGKISGADFAAADGKYIASFSGLNALQMRTVVTAEVYDGDTCVSNTLDYSIESYAAGKAAGNDALAALVNAMMNFGISAETYFAK